MRAYAFLRTTRTLGTLVFFLQWPFCITCVALIFGARSAYFSLTHTKVDYVEMVSPDHAYVAKGYHLYAGIKDPPITYVRIRPNDIDPFYRADDLLIATGNRPFHLQWMGKRNLTVECSTDRADVKTTAWRDVTIHFVDWPR